MLKKHEFHFLHFYSDRFTESGRFTFCFLTVFLKKRYLKNTECVTTFFWNVSLLTNLLLFNT
eukprot:UN00868